MAQLQCKTLGGVSPRGKARVYFACHPEDHKGYFQEVTDQILKPCDCAVYYYEEEPEQNDEYYVNLERMQLFVMPVTTRLLYLPNRAMDVEFRYAMEHHIPVLPLMQEQGLEEKYAEKFGNLQFLDKGNRDLTAIPYEEKLKKYLDAVLLNDELTAQVRAAFDAWIFLSYRKKDRKEAQELMRLIHSDPRCRDIAIWYDEFLNPGEDFNDAIRKALAESQLFVLAVTPNLLEQGNYVMREEYPEARKAGKPILPAEMEKTDREAFRDGFPGVPDPLDPGADGMVSGAVLDALSALAVRENDKDPKHNFFIGLAYLSGLFVEKDHPRAVKLITQSAEAGLTEAMEKLVTMYETGEGVERNYHIAIQWREKLVEQARFHLTEVGGETKDIYRFIVLLSDLGDAWKSVWNLDQAKVAYEEMLDVAEQIFSILGDCTSEFYVGSGYRHLAGIAISEGDLVSAEKMYRKNLDVAKRLAQSETPEDLRLLYCAYFQLGATAQLDNELKSAKEWYTEGLKIWEHLAQNGTLELLQDVCSLYFLLAYIELLENDTASAKEWCRKELEIAERLAQSGSPMDLQILKDCYACLADIARRENDSVSANEWDWKSLEIAEHLASEYGTGKGVEDLALQYLQLGCLENNIDLIDKGLRLAQMLSEEYPGNPTFSEYVHIAEEAITELQNKANT